MEDIIAKIKKRRTDLNMSYQDLANKTGLSKSTLQRYETGSIKNMPIDKLEVIANALNISPACLMGWEDIKETNQTEDTISIKERKLLDDFNKLNEVGKDEAIKRLSELTLIDTYTKNEIEYRVKKLPSKLEDNLVEYGEIETLAAHNDHINEPGEIEKIMEDFNDMDNWE